MKRRWDLGVLIWIVDVGGNAILQCRIHGWRRKMVSGSRVAGLWYEVTMPDGEAGLVPQEKCYATHIEAEEVLLSALDRTG
jgi:hypothetical protein